MKERLDQHIVTKYNLSRSRAQKLIKAGHIKINGEKVKTGHMLRETDVLEVNIPPVEKMEIKAEDIPLDILYEDDDLVVVHKPSGMVTHPAYGNYTGTLVHALLYKIKGLSGIGGIERPGIIHRLDKYTDGLLIVAKNDLAHQKLSEQIKAREVKRKYIALVRGIVVNNEGTISAPIGRHPKYRKKMAVTRKQSRAAITHYKVLERDKKKNCTRLELTLETGRTHQIRVHLAFLGYPLVGEPVYARKKGEGQKLCAYYLQFNHPRTGKALEFEITPPF
ncbi:RluA family pseudouridine synthase [Candidatus Margulisiibacteriota bacterium]